MWATGGALPDVTVLLDLDPSVARRRLDADDKPFDRLEAEKAEFHVRVREAFLALADAEPERFLVVDAALPRDEIQARIRARIAALL
jgi:dTMP kinase